MVNLKRGEYELFVNDASYTLVLSLGDLEAIEGQLSVGASELLTQLSSGRPRLSDINVILLRALTNVRPRLEKKEVNIVLKEIGFQDRYKAALRLVAGSMDMLEDQQGPEAKKDEEEDEDTPKVEAKPARPLSLVTGGSTGES